MTEWLDLVISMKDSNPDLTFKEVLIKAKKEYRKMNRKKAQAEADKKPAKSKKSKTNKSKSKKGKRKNKTMKRRKA